MARKVVFIPGNGGCTTQDNWFPYLEAELKREGVEVVAATFPDPELARSSYWLPFLQDEIGVDDQTVLVGHSSGALAAMRLAEMQPILGSALVGAYHTDLGMESEKQSGYLDEPWDWEKIRKNQQWTLLFAAQDDPWISVEEPRHIHRNLGCEYHEFINGGHFGGDYYKETFPELAMALLSRLRVGEFK